MVNSWKNKKLLGKKKGKSFLKAGRGKKKKKAKGKTWFDL